MLCDKCGKEANKQVTVPFPPYVVCYPCSNIKKETNAGAHSYIYSNGIKQISRARFKEAHKKFSGHVPPEPR
jgi:outer membrane protein assembly factor BamD (BamD/ComL family)